MDGTLVLGEYLGGRDVGRKKLPDSTKMIAPIYMSDEDMALVDNTAKILWLRTGNDVFLQCLRVAWTKSESGIRQFKPYIYKTPGVYQDGEGRTLILRPTEEEMATIEQMREFLRVEHNTDAIRAIIRFGANYFANQTI